MPNPKIIRIINSILTLIILIGCDNIRQDKQETALEATLSTYQSAMRWGYWDALLSFFNTPVAPETLTNLDNVRVTAYEIRQPTILVTKQKIPLCLWLYVRISVSDCV
ncbi:hypothetical protein TI05_18265 [Achromatium sp. WMS3]|nr:hypothetical protein TI05_18265 [Achromatium sp. WMS3]